MNDDENAIRKLVADWLAASKTGDHAKVLSLMADDVVFLIPGQPPMRGKAAFASSQKALANFRIDAVADIQEVRVFGEWAYCWNHLEVTVTPREGGAAMRRAGNVLSILQKQASGAWVIVRDANLLTPVTN